MLKGFKKLFSKISEVITVKGVIAADKSLKDSERIQNLSLSIVDDINAVMKSKIQVEKSIKKMKSSSESHLNKSKERETLIKDSLAKGLEVSDSQYLIALQSKTISDHLRAKAEADESSLPDYDTAIIALNEALDELMLQRELTQLKEEGEVLGIAVGEVDVVAKYKAVDVNTLVTKIKIKGDVTVSGSSSLELAHYKASLLEG